MVDNEWLVVGGGPVALALAASLTSAMAAGGKDNNGRVLLIRPTPQPARERHYALNANSAKFLESIKAMPPVCEVHIFNLHTANNKKPTVQITAADAGLSRLCAIASEEALMHSLEKATKKTIQTIEDNQWQQCHYDNHGITLTVKDKDMDKNYRGKFLAVADGANSPLARLLNIHPARHPFQQTALTATVNAEMDNDTAAQWFDNFNTLALLPLLSKDKKQFSLIWSMPNDKTKTITAENLATEATKHTGIKITNATNIATFPLVASRRAVRALPNIIFVGDSAATIHPLAGQGLNLGFVDAAQLTELSTLKDNADLSSLNSYLRHRHNRADIWSCITRSLCYGNATKAALMVASCSPFLRNRAARFANLF